MNVSYTGLVDRVKWLLVGKGVVLFGLVVAAGGFGVSSVHAQSCGLSPVSELYTTSGDGIDSCHAGWQLLQSTLSGNCTGSLVDVDLDFGCIQISGPSVNVTGAVSDVTGYNAFETNSLTGADRSSTGSHSCCQPSSPVNGGDVCSSDSDCGGGTGSCSSYPYPCLGGYTGLTFYATGTTNCCWMTGGSATCGPVDGTTIYDVDNAGDALSGGSAGLCSGGVATGFSYNSGFHVWSWDCTAGTGMSSCSASETYCGDGITSTGDGEQCDDGNMTGGDGCSSTCQIEPSGGVCGAVDGTTIYDVDNAGDGLTTGSAGLCATGSVTGFSYNSGFHIWSWSCDNGSGVAVCSASEAYCGDSITSAIYGEQCDDGNMMSGDGCSATCQNEIVGTGSCGDGIVQTPNSSGFNEQCDDANSDNGDACLNSCESNTCGDSYLYTGFEECDDGNLLDGDGCSSSCLVEAGGSDSRAGGSLTKGRCGDGELKTRNGEECDDGNYENGDGCNDRCEIEDLTDRPEHGVGDKMQYSIAAAVRNMKRRCDYNDIDYGQIQFEDIIWSPDRAAITTLQAACIINGYGYGRKAFHEYNAEALLGIGEAIKMVAKLSALDQEVAFDERAHFSGPLPYDDMKPHSRYNTYVLYAKREGMLRGFGVSRMAGEVHLKALTPISAPQLQQLLYNAGIETNYRDRMGVDGQVTREQFARIALDARVDKLEDYTYLGGRNTIIYDLLLAYLEDMDYYEQREFIEQILENLDSLDPDFMAQKYNVDLRGVRAFLQKALDETEDSGSVRRSTRDYRQYFRRR